jgi:hypothetical protein
MKRCIVSFADTPVYQAKMRRLEKSIPYGIDFLGFTSIDQIGSKSHQEVPYAFKPASIAKAKELGYDVVLWCDSPIHVIKPLDQAFEYLEENGYFFFDNIGHSLGMWTNDKCLEYFGMTREEALNVKMIMACCMGFNFKFEEVNDLANEYYELADMLYPGSWSNHRHDQTVMSFLLHRDGFNILVGQDTFFAYKNHHGVLPIADSVCLLSE